jgi:hypothetical protein
MPTVIVLALPFGLFTEERVPAEGYACLNIQLSGYDAVVDSLTCTCHESWRLSGRCVDR